MRCARCGNDNPDENRFCGMCGATLLKVPAASVAETQTQRAAGASPALPSPVTVAAVPPVEPPRVAPPPPRAEPVRSEPRSEPTISGPSFLGLNDPGPRKRGSLSIDPHSSSNSRSLDYLLDDEEEPRRGGAGKFVLILLALALAVGFGYLRWKNQGFGWLTSIASKPSPAAETPAESSVPTSPAGTPDAQPPAAAQPAPSQPAAAPTKAPDAAATSASNSPSGTPAQTPAPDTSASTPSPTKADAPNTATKKNPPDDADDDNSADNKEPAATTAAAPAPKPDKVDKPKAGREPAATKPSAAAKPVRAGDPVAEAQRYLYGRGAAQDCDHGLRILKPAANESNSKAMIQMGALYSAGLCTPRDLPTAYRWFALALRKDPDNTAVQTDLQKLWGEMTQPERQLAIKLSQ
jgi:hypothetical protein